VSLRGARVRREIALGQGTCSRALTSGAILAGTVSTAPFFGSVEGEEVASSLGGYVPRGTRRVRLVRGEGRGVST
jgi:hypothetical protein